MRMPSLHAAMLTVLCGGLLSAAPVFGQTQPPENYDPAGEERERILRDELLRQQRQQEGEKPEDGPAVTGSQAYQPSKLPETDHRFTLEAIKFPDSAFFPPEKLQALADEFVGREIGFADLNRLIDRINGWYAQEGIITGHALIPPQRISDGVLQVALIEGRLGAVELDGNRHTRESFIRNRLPLEPDQVLDVPSLGQAIDWFNRTSDLRLGAALRPGANAGETDVLLRVQEPPLWQAHVFTDNAGAESTGEYRGGVTLERFGLLGVADSLSLLLLGSEGSRNASMGYKFPVNRSGGQVNLRYVEGDIEVIEGPFSEFDLEGDSREYSAGFEQPFLRGQRWWLDGDIRYSSSESDSTLDGFAFSEYQVDRYSLGVRVMYFGARSQWMLHQSVASASVTNILDEEDRHTLYDGYASYSARLNERWRPAVRAGWRYSSEEALPSPLQSPIGGAATVRGYTEGVLSGSRSLFANIEIHYTRWSGMSPFVFADYGMIDDVTPDREAIQSVGVGTHWRWGRYFSGDLTWGQTLKDILPDQDPGRLHLRISLNWPNA